MSLSLYLLSHKAPVLSLSFDPHYELSASFWLLSIRVCCVVKDTQTHRFLYFYSSISDDFQSFMNDKSCEVELCD